MAPTLKEIDAVVSVAAAPLPATAATISAKSERVRNTYESSSSGMPTDGHVSAGAVPPPALAANSPPLQLQQIATSSAPTKQLITQIERENPNGIPPDESAFLIEPHFSRHNPFHRHLSNLDLAMRCAICSELYHAPVTLIPCMHAFCSLCVRNHFKSTLTG